MKKLSLVLCFALMLVLLFAFNAFAAGDVAPAQTGSPNNTWAIVAVVVALFIVVACVVVPKISKK